MKFFFLVSGFRSGFLLFKIFFEDYLVSIIVFFLVKKIIFSKDDDEDILLVKLIVNDFVSKLFYG